jgi:branched-chain amino acid transport system substrate-binding protein
MEHNMIATTKRLGVAAATLSLLVVAGCASSTESSSSTSAAPTGTLDMSTAQKSTGDPIKVGYLNPSIGANAFVDNENGAKAAEWYINNYLGGMTEGRPIELVNCDSDNTPEKNVSCANTFVEEKVVAVIPGNVINDGATLPVLEAAGIPQIGNVPQDQNSVATQKNFYIGPAQALFAVGPFKGYEQAGYKSVALLQVDLPASHDYVDTFLIPAGKKAGIDVTPVYFDADNVNWATLAQSLIATNADVLGHVSLTEDQNVQMVKALRAANYDGPVQVGVSTKFINELGVEAAENAVIYTPNWLPQAAQYAPPEMQKQLNDFSAALGETGGNAPTVNAAMSYATFVTFAKVLKQMQGEVTGPAISTAFQNLKDFPSELGPNITCDHTVWPGQSACSNEILLFSVEADGSFKPIADPAYVSATPADV